MRTLSAFAGLLGLTAALAAPCAAQSAAGATAFDFLNLDVSARPVGMAGAYTALATDSNALLYNPAGLAGVAANEATFTHNQYVEGVTQEYLSYASTQHWGLSVNFLNWGGIGRTTLSQPGGTGSEVGYNDLAFGGGYARSLGALSLGVGLKMLREQIDDVTATGFALDGGALYRVERVQGLVVGAALRNVGPDVKFQTTKEKLPTELRVGAGYSRVAFGAGHTAAFDLGKDRFDNAKLGFGLESVLGRILAVRLGYTTRNDAGMGIAAGVGWLLESARFDYAIVPFDDLGVAHRVSLTYRWGDTDPEAKPAETKPAEAKPAEAKPK